LIKIHALIEHDLENTIQKKYKIKNLQTQKYRIVESTENRRGVEEELEGSLLSINKTYMYSS
jgi:hypothetical protein